MGIPDIKSKNIKGINIFNSPTVVNPNFFKILTASWLHFLQKDSSLGFLLENNSYEKDLTGRKIRLLHVTPAVDKIESSGKLYSSGGGLGSVIYCCPLHKNNFPHNLFYLYLNYQLPKKIKKGKIAALCIELNGNFLPREIKKWAIDYTLFGEIHCKVWEDIKKCLNDPDYIKMIEDNIYKRIKKRMGLLNRLITYDMENITNTEFNKIYNEIFADFPELRFILYEVLAEYILLYQNNKVALKYATKGEVYNQNHKEFIWALCPTMLQKFNMNHFFIPLEQVITF